MEFGASIRAAWDADFGEKQLAGKLAGRARIGDHEDGHAGLILMPKQGPEPAGLDIGGGKGFGEETDADAENCEPLRFVEMLGQLMAPRGFFEPTSGRMQLSIEASAQK
jgi:hypothetical protein